MGRLGNFAPLDSHGARRWSRVQSASSNRPLLRQRSRYSGHSSVAVTTFTLVDSRAGRRGSPVTRLPDGGRPLTVTFHGDLRPEQQVAADAMLKHETGVLSATTAFGKTVVAAWLIAQRGVNTWYWSRSLGVEPSHSMSAACIVFM